MAEITKTNLLYPANGMNLAATLFCGQSFVWREAAPGLYRGVCAGRAAEVSCENDTLCVRPLSAPAQDDEVFWQHYFALDIDYPALEAKFSTHKKLAECVAAGRGIRVLHQPFFDTLLSFIISQNNNIGRITGIVQRLCEGFGTEIAPGLHGFPAPETLAALTPEDLAPLRAGFRAKYLIDAARRVAGGEVSEAALRAATTEEAREMLCHITGVGTKVADCVLLYALGRQVAPMDVWMKRAMGTAFPKGMPRAAKGFEGIAQQYIFVWARENL